MGKFCFIIILLSICLGTNAASREPFGEGIIKVSRFYPNPATTVIYFEFKNSDASYTLQIYNFLGKKLISQQVNSSKISISLDNFYRGLYVYQLRDASGNIEESGKFQILK